MKSSFPSQFGVFFLLTMPVVLAPACGSKTQNADQVSSAASALSSTPAPPDSRSAVASASVSAAAASLDLSSLPGRSDGCSEGMVRVAGDYCPDVDQKCIQHHKEFEKNKDDKNVSERCMKYESPSVCLSKTRLNLSFCMDRFEYPNQVGELPWVLTSWTQAKNLCEKQGKRLCTEREFNFACEGPEMLPYATGYVRDTSKCNMDKPYYLPDHSRQLRTYKECLETPWCEQELKRLDQRHAIGSKLSCVSWAGIIDINGNVNEWVFLPKGKPPSRSGLKGGWWGPVRSRCRPTVTFHKENDYGYEAGFRCCKDAT